MVLVDFEIINEFGYENDYSYLEKVIKKCLEIEKVEKAIFSIIFVNEEKIQEINYQYRHIDKVTDVISFAFLESKQKINNNLNILGEIFICIPRMQEQAKSYNHSEKRELSFLTIHGLLHLLGYDHLKKEDEVVMFAKQELILNESGIPRGD